MNFSKRIKKVQGYFQEWKCDGLLIEDAINLYYLTGLQLSAGKLFIDKSDAYLMVDSRYFDSCKRNKALIVKLAQTGKDPLEELLLNECSQVGQLAFDTVATSYKGFCHLKKLIQKIAKSEKRKIALVPLDRPLTKLRSIKDPEEIELLSDAAELGSKGFDFACSRLRLGITEIEVANELEIFWKQHGSKGLAFEPIIAFGANSSMPHYRAGNVKLKKNDAVLIDIGVNLQHYHSDMTRMVYFGKPDPCFLEIHAVVQEAQKAALDLCRPGTSIGNLDIAARAVMAKYGYEDKFIHSLGHGVGLEIHEHPFLRNAAPYKDLLLEKGMVITIEPGIYLSGFGGVRLEDTIVITQKGYKNLTQRYVVPLIIS